MIPHFLLALLCLSLASCLRLDSNLFNPNVNPITAYRFDAYPDFEEPRLEPRYDIPDSLIHLFTLESQDAQGQTRRIYAVYVGDTQRIATDTVWLYCHGNKNHMDHYWQRTKLLANVGGKNRYGVLTFDYQGYGLSEGRPSEFALYQDTDAAMQWLARKGLTADRLAIYGFSMGSAPATRLAAAPRSLRPAWLCLEAPFASAAVMVQDGSKLSLSSRYFTDLQIDNIEQIKQVQQPFYWIHGTADDFLSLNAHGRPLANNYRGLRKTEVLVNGAGHSDIPHIQGIEAYLNSLANFLRP